MQRLVTKGAADIAEQQRDAAALSIAAVLVAGLQELETAEGAPGTPGLDDAARSKLLAQRVASELLGMAAVDEVYVGDEELEAHVERALQKYARVDETADRRAREQIKAPEGTAEWEDEYLRRVQALPA